MTVNRSSLDTITQIEISKRVFLNIDKRSLEIASHFSETLEFRRHQER